MNLQETISTKKMTKERLASIKRLHNHELNEDVFQHARISAILRSNPITQQWLSDFVLKEDQLDQLIKFIGIQFIKRKKIIYCALTFQKLAKNVLKCFLQFNVAKQMTKSGVVNLFSDILDQIPSIEFFPKPIDVSQTDLVHACVNIELSFSKNGTLVKTIYFGIPEGPRNQKDFKNLMRLREEYLNQLYGNTTYDLALDTSHQEAEVQERLAKDENENTQFFLNKAAELKEKLFPSIALYPDMQNDVRSLGVSKKEEAQILELGGIDKSFYPIKKKVDKAIKSKSKEKYSTFQTTIGFGSSQSSLARQIRSKATDKFSPLLLRFRDTLAMYYILEKVLINKQGLRWVSYFEEIYALSPGLYQDFIEVRVLAEASRVKQFRRNKAFENRIREQLSLFEKITNIKIFN